MILTIKTTQFDDPEYFIIRKKHHLLRWFSHKKKYLLLRVIPVAFSTTAQIPTVPQWQFHLAYILTYFLAFDLASFQAFILASILDIYSDMISCIFLHYMASILTFFLTFFLTFLLACVRVQAWPTASGAGRKTGVIQRGRQSWRSAFLKI